MLWLLKWIHFTQRFKSCNPFALWLDFTHFRLGCVSLVASCLNSCLRCFNFKFCHATGCESYETRKRRKTTKLLQACILFSLISFPWLQHFNILCDRLINLYVNTLHHFFYAVIYYSTVSLEILLSGLWITQGVKWGDTNDLKAQYNSSSSSQTQSAPPSASLWAMI